MIRTIYGEVGVGGIGHPSTFLGAVLETALLRHECHASTNGINDVMKVSKQHLSIKVLHIFR